MLKVIIFDFAGVITNEGYWGWLQKTVPNISEKKDFFMSLADKADKGEFSQEEYARVLAQETGRSVENIPQEILDGYVVNEEMVRLLSILKNQIPLGLLSNFPSGWLRPLLKKYDLLKYFNQIVISSEVHMIKPHKDIFLHAVSLFHVEPQEAFFIDDREINAQGAKQAGLQGVIFKSVDSLKEELKNVGLQI